MQRSDAQSAVSIRLALPSKGRLETETLAFLMAAGLHVYKPNPRQYLARIPALPDLTILFQRAGDIVVSVREGSVDFGITGLDAVHERRGEDGRLVILHDALGFGQCALTLAAPEEWSQDHLWWQEVRSLPDLAACAASLGEQGRALRVATKFPRLVGRFLDEHGVAPYSLIASEGALEAAPSIGYADIIADLVSSGTTLRDNRLRPLADGVILHSQACLIANRRALQTRPEVLAAAREILEYVEAHLRAEECCLVFANMRGESPEAVAARMFSQPGLGGLQGPTLSRVFVRDGSPNWHAVNIVVRKNQLTQAIGALRAVGGSGVVVSPVTYIFEEEPERYRALVAALQPEG